MKKMKIKTITTWNNKLFELMYYRVSRDIQLNLS